MHVNQFKYTGRKFRSFVVHIKSTLSFFTLGEQDHCFLLACVDGGPIACGFVAAVPQK